MSKPTHQEFSIELNDTESNGSGPMSKAQKKAARKAKNKEWSRQLKSKQQQRVEGEEEEDEEESPRSSSQQQEEPKEEVWDPNPKHSIYYQAQLQCLNEKSEWNSFQTCLAVPLPTVFRLGFACPSMMAQVTRGLMNSEFKTMTGRFVEIRGEVIKDNIVTQLPWFAPSATVWQCMADASTIKHSKAFESLSDFLVREVNLGHMVRQELASMIPALCLQVKHHHRVLDICAAPGSKTEQLLTLMKADAPASSDGVCTGMVVANDADPYRINILKERYDRCRSPNLVLTCSKAEDLQSAMSAYMKARAEAEAEKEEEMRSRARAIAEETLFDRIVADVPCSGDGTIRKFPHIYRLFRPRYSLDLHSVQLQIAKASVELLKHGGRMVYSTCSLNPLEDEAVVCGLLRHYGPNRLRLIDISKEEEGGGILPDLATRPGLSDWRADPDVFMSGETEEERKESIGRLPAITKSMLPPNKEETAWMHLHRTHRILPHDMDCGGFFVAVLELIGERDEEGGGGDNANANDDNDRVDSTSIMKELGYNPRRNNELAAKAAKKQAKAASASSKKRSILDSAAGATPSGWRPVSVALAIDEDDEEVEEEVDVELGELLRSTGLSALGMVDLPVAPLRIVQTTQADPHAEAAAKRQRNSGEYRLNSQGKFMKKVPKESSHGQELHEKQVCLASREVQLALCGWAGFGLGQADAGLKIVQAGALLFPYTGKGGYAEPVGGLSDNSALALAQTLKQCRPRAASSAEGEGEEGVSPPPLVAVGAEEFDLFLEAGLNDNDGNGGDEQQAYRSAYFQHVLECVPKLGQCLDEHRAHLGNDDDDDDDESHFYFIVALEHTDATDASAAADTVDNVIGAGGDGGKRRLSKAERKKLGNKKQQDGSSSGSSSDRAGSNAAVAGTGGTITPTPVAVAALTIRVTVYNSDDDDDNGRPPSMQVLSAGDKCQSYRDMLVRSRAISGDR
jgi:16S rRNA C967 or C1407 C5-methylase (RsmB/RsmF family)